MVELCLEVGGGFGRGVFVVFGFDGYAAASDVAVCVYVLVVDLVEHVMVPIGCGTFILYIVLLVCQRLLVWSNGRRSL